MGTQYGQTEKDRRLVALAVLAFLALGTYTVLSPFLVSIAWAVILVFVTWPVYRFIKTPLGRRPGLAAAIMTLLLALVIIAPVGFLVFAAIDELRGFVSQVTESASSPEFLDRCRKWAESLPMAGPHIAQWLKEVEKDLSATLAQMGANLGTLYAFAQGLVGATIAVIFKIAMCLFTAYFLYRHGDVLGAQLARVALSIGGPRYENLLSTIRATVRAAVYGVLLTSLAQGFLAGIGFFAVSAPVPLLLSLATVVASLIPFAPPVIYLGAAGYMLATGADWWWPAALALWGVAVVSSADNVIRPLFISQATQTPLLLVFFGVIGGIVAFGLIGVILGPVILTVAMVLWKEWAQAEDADHSLDTGHA
jgi:predicted PurR-regulated permease PerM